MSTETNSGLELFDEFIAGQGGWAAGQVSNWTRMGAVGFHLAVLDRDLTAPPGSPETGDVYIVGSGATGDWSGQDDSVAYFDPNGSSTGWVFYTPRAGWLAFIQDESVLSIYKGDTNGWSAGVAI